MEKEVKLLTVLNKKDFFQDVSFAALSPSFSLLCVVNKQKNATIHQLPDDTKSSYLWQCPHKSKSCLFSEDGKQILFLLSVNSIHIFKIDDDIISSTVQIKTSNLAEILKPHSIDYSAISSVIPLRLRRGDLLLEVDGRIICLEWGLAGSDPSVKFSIPLPNHDDVSMSSTKLFVLSHSDLYCYNLSNGMKSAEIVNLCLANRANADISVGRTFRKCAADPSGQIIAVVNQDEQVALLELSEAFDRVEAKTPVGEEVRKEKWSWPGKKRAVADVKSFPGHVLSLVEPLPGVVVSHFQYSLHGLFIFYSVMGSVSYTNAKAVNPTSGEILCVIDGLAEFSLISGGRLPVLRSCSSLSVCLGALSSDNFVSLLCDFLSDFCTKDVLHGELDSQKLSEVDDDVYAEFMKIILSLHSNCYKNDLLRITEKSSDESVISSIRKNIITRIEKLYTIVTDEGEDERPVAFVFLHMVHLLDLTCLSIKGACGREIVPCLETLCAAFLERLILLYPAISHLELLRYEWMVWRGMSMNEVVEEAVTLGTVALALVFFVTERKWAADQAVEKFKNITNDFIKKLTSVGDLEKVTLALNTLGCDPLKYLKELCLATNEPLLRDLLVTHLRDAGRFTEEEESAWRFCKSLENALSSFVITQRSFEHKMVVSLTEKVANVAPLKSGVFKGSLELETVLKENLQWRKNVITELYFATGDVTLESQLERDLCWRYLLEKNCIELLKHWIDASFSDNKPQPNDYIFKMLVAMLSRWTVTPEMLDTVHGINCMTATREYILDRAASYGVFSSRECGDIPAVTLRLRNTCSLTNISEILKKPTANVGLNDFYSWFLRECSKINVKLPILSCLWEANKSGELNFASATFQWLPLWRDFESWDGSDPVTLSKLIRLSLDLFPPAQPELPFVKLALAQVEGVEIVEIIKREGPNCDLLKIAPLEICWQSLQRSRKPDVTLYNLLAGCHLPVERLFSWQTENSYVAEPHALESFPHFNHQVLNAKYGHKQYLDYLYYLEKGRPSFACNLFFVESLRKHKRLTTHMISRACGFAHGLGLRLWDNQTVGSACVAFIVMLGDLPAANALRLHLAALQIVADYVPVELRPFIGNLAHGIITKDIVQLQDLASLLENATFNANKKLDVMQQLKLWSVPVTFCYLHGLPLPTLLPRILTKEEDWYHFILCLDLFKYPYDLAIELIESMDAPVLKAHLLRALTRTTLKFATSPSKSPPLIRLEPDSGGEDAEVKDTFEDYVRSIYTEVLTTIQTFTDRNIVLPWSCEQNPDHDVLLTLLKCESEPDTAKALLLSALELQSPILAVFATCYNFDNIARPLMAWLLASVPTSLPRSRLREEGQYLLLGRELSPDLVQELLLQFFDTAYFQTFYRGMTLFLPDNPLTFVVETIYRCIVELDTIGALSALKAFVLEMVHGQGRSKEGLVSREWILSTSSRLVESVLTRSDVPYASKLLFLKVLSDAELASVDEALPKFLLWHQISEILEPAQVRLNFAQLYDMQFVHSEMERCFDELFAKRAFTAALEIAALLSLNQDRIILALWEQKFRDGIETGDLTGMWSESSAAFKDENVNPTLVPAFYHNIVTLITEDTVNYVRNKYLGLRYCLSWRKLVENTLLPSFREESDTIELELWETCLQDGFDWGTFADFNTCEAFAMLVAEWPPPKLLVRAASKTAPDPAKVSALISALLDTGDLKYAMRVSAFFTCENQDLKTICSCLQVALGELPPSELAQYSSLLSPKKLLTPAIDAPVFEETTAFKEPPIVALLERLCGSVSHGKTLAQRICVSTRLAFTLEIPFKSLAAETDCFELLERAVTADCANKMAVARDILWLARLPDSALVQFLSERIVRAFSARAMTGMDVPARLWDVNLEENFHRILSLLKNPAILGLKLLKASAHLPFPEGVEILIKAHDCYSVACNVEGIGLVLRRARVLSQQILQAQQWRHLVRLLVGIRRYSDMSYIFQMLKDNDQFEHLLRKGAAKAAGLHLAVMDFLQRTCPEDRELGKMAALAYGLHSYQATLWEQDADEILLKLIPPLKDTSKARQVLNLAMENYSHAAMCYLEAGKVNKALKISRKAQVVALQIPLLGISYVLNLSESQLQVLAQDSLSVANIMVLMKAREIQIDWLVVLHERWVLKGDKTFFNDLKTAEILGPSLITRYLHKYENDASLGGRAKDRIKQLQSLLPNSTSRFMFKTKQ